MKGVFIMNEEKFYIFNLETTKIELEFDKADYDAMPEDQKKKLRSAFLFSGRSKRWVSRAKEPNLYRAKEVAISLGFVSEKRENERISYGEHLEKKAERAETRADRYEGYADNASTRAQELQKPLNDKRGDIAFFTQPIIAGHSGSQAFAKRREKIYAQYDKGFEEYRKSEYFKQRASTARNTANMEKLKNKGFVDRKIKECKKEIRKRKKNVEYYELELKRIEAGEQLKKFDQSPLTIAEVSRWLDNELELIEVAQDREGFFLNILDELGGVQFSFKDIKIGYIVALDKWGHVEVIGKGTQNISYKILTGGAAGMCGQAAYAEIKEILSSEEKREAHPFTVGETFTAKRYVNDDGNYATREVVFEIVKASDKTIQLKERGTDNKPITRKPVKVFGGKWCFTVDEHFNSTYYKMPSCLEKVNSSTGGDNHEH